MTLLIGLNGKHQYGSKISNSIPSSNHSPSFVNFRGSTCNDKQVSVSNNDNNSFKNKYLVDTSFRSSNTGKLGIVPLVRSNLKS